MSTKDPTLPTQRVTVRRLSKELAQQVQRLVASQPETPSGTEAMMRAELDEQDGIPRKPLFGLALSGGGIRSATFNLGLLQGLQDRQLLSAFDYMSTVSGGGYVGGFWSAWRARGKRSTDFPSDPRRSNNPAGEVEAPEIRHLREFGNFLSPQIGPSSFDTGRVIAAMASAAIPALLMSFSLIMLALLLWLMLTRAMATPIAINQAGWFVAWLPRLVVVGSLALLLAKPEKLWRLREGRVHRDNPPRVRRDNTYLFLSVLALWGAAGGWTLAQYISRRLGYYPDPLITEAGRDPAHFGMYQGLVESFLNFAPGFRPFFSIFDPHGFVLHSHALGIPELVGMLEPAIAILLATLAIILLRAVRSQSLAIPRPGKGDSAQRQHRISNRSAYDRIIARMLLAVAIWAVPAVAWFVGLKFYEDYNMVGVGSVAGAMSAMLAFAFSKVQRIIVQQPSRPTLDTFTEKLRPMLPKMLAFSTLAAMVLVCQFIILAFFSRDLLSFISTLVLAITLIGLLFVDANTVGMHEFYRGRIARAYLGASNEKHRDARYDRTEEHANDDLSLRDLRRTDEPAGKRERPVHLICCAANDISQYGRLRNLRRGAESAVFSSVGYSVGDQWRRWEENDSTPTLAAAMTASGAAFNSLMGGRSMELGPAVTFLMTTLNLRLGMWYRHPKYLRTESMSLVELRTPGKPFYDELLGSCNSNKPRIHLSDGGHFENTGVYELIRRRCQFILASDCGMDPQITFDDVANLVRRVREDFGAEIRIDVSPLRPDKSSGYARQPMVAGDIYYPDGSTGVLLIIKPTLTGNEPTDIAQYHGRNLQFPHETTLDQFYDEAQWESYRRLGRHIAHTAFPSDLLPAKPEVGDFVRMFGKLRLEWLPAPADFEDSERYLKNRSAAIDNELRQAPVLRAEVYPESSLESAPKAVVLTQRELTQSFHTIQQAVLLLEEIYLQRDFKTQYNHPQNLGWINYMGRWAHAPLLAMYWPLLRARVSEEFARFMEGYFSLPKLRQIESSVRPGMRSGMAASAYFEQTGDLQPKSGIVLEYLVCLHHIRYGKREIQAALLRYFEQKDHVFWEAGDLFLPAGLWGIGFGDDFLRALGRKPSPFPGKTAVVRIPAVQSAAPAEGKELVDRVQLYRSNGFRCAMYNDGRIIYGSADPVEVPAELRPEEGQKFSWYARIV